MANIIPTINGASNLSVIKERLEQVIGAVKKVQIDVVDGQYADAKTWPFIEKNSNDLFEMAHGEKKFPFIDDFTIQFDLMILHPVEYLDEFISLGAKSFVIHIDSTDHIKECLELIKSSGCEAGLGIRPSADSAFLEPFLPLADFVQFMGSDRIGHSGVDLDENVLEKIKNFHEEHPSMPTQIDIGVDETTIPRLKEAGATSFISGSAIFNSPDIKEALAKLRNM